MVYLNYMNNCKTKILFIISSIVFLFFALSWQVQIVHTASHSTILQISSIETSTRSDSPVPVPKLLAKRPRPSVIKVEIQSGIIRIPDQFARVEKFVIIKTANLYHLKPQFSFVRYLPRDPPLA